MSIQEIFCDNEIDESKLYISVCVGVTASKNASKTLLSLSEMLPLERFGLRHLKRARKGSEPNTIDIIICPLYYINTLDIVVGDYFDSTYTTEVCQIKPILRSQFEEWGRNWPIVFRPSEESQARDVALPSSDIQDMVGNMEHILCSQELYGNAIIVNPLNNKVIMTAAIASKHIFSNSSVDHPLYTPLCQCIEGVSALIRGDMQHASVFNNPDDVMPSDQYICTGLDIYVIDEPDVMEAMALVHSRIRRVVFKNRNIYAGGLGGAHSIHGLPNLNHHYRVFQYYDTNL